MPALGDYEKTFRQDGFEGRWQGDVDHDGLRPPADRLAQGQKDRQVHRADRARRVAHVWHGRPVPPDRHLRPRRPAVRTGRFRVRSRRFTRRRRTASCWKKASPKPAAMSSLHRRRHRVQLARREHDSDLHLLLDVRVPADRRPDLGRRRHARQGLPDRRHRGPHHAQRRRPAAPGWPQPCERHRVPDRAGLRPGLRLRDGGDRHRRPASGCTKRTRRPSTTSRSKTRTT